MFPLRDSLRSETMPLVTVALILANLLAFFYELTLDDYTLHYFLSHWGTVPSHFQFLDIFTSMFLHGGWMHVLGNMWFLWIFGDNIEDILGHGQYLVFYLLCGVAGGLLHVYFNPESSVPAIGASGAISGVMGAYLVSFPHARVHTLVIFIFFITTIDVPAFLMIGYWFVVQLFSGVGQLANASANGGGTAWFAHVGGFLAGVILIRLMPTRRRSALRLEDRW
ncbi:rhomboid family intramembrane serine protease [Bryobacter aggregatus]|uniref:rhomboid family intramembrane serine protease n=1 Tax=Bryobacter aggregatus TaxID=360054 RepID=UPI0004E1873E|nr:rhomboid family intramembrane serine protease [Bryobacter aggregatus]